MTLKLLPILCILLLATSNSTDETSIAQGALLRFAAIMMLLLPALLSRDRAKVGAGPALRSMTTGIHVLLYGQLIFLSAALFAHDDYANFAYRTVSLILILLLLYACLSYPDHEALAQGVIIGLSLVCLFALAILILGVPEATENGRLRGSLGNANTLGFLAALLIVMSVVYTKSHLLQSLVFFLSGTVLLLSASRGALLFLTVTLVVLGIERWRIRRRLVKVLILGGGALFAFLLVNDAPEILRTDNSRDDSVGLAIQAWKQAPFLGIGRELGVQLPIAGSFSAGLVWGGVVGLAGLILLTIGFLMATLKGWSGTRSLAAGAIIYSLVESWMLSLNGLTAIVLLLCWAVVWRKSDQDSMATRNRRGAVESRVSMSPRPKGGQSARIAP